MSVAGYVALLICALTAAAVGGMLPFLTSGLSARERRGVSIPTVAMAAALGAMASARLGRGSLDAVEIITAVIFAFALIIGIIAEWIRQTIRTGALQPDALCAGLLMAAVSAIGVGGYFGRHLSGVTMGLWFAWGVGWQAGCSGWFRLLEPEPPPRRRDPPDLGVLGCHLDLWRKYPRGK